MLVSQSLEANLVAVFQNRPETEFFRTLQRDNVHDNLLIAFDSAEILKLIKYRYTQPSSLKVFANFIMKMTTLRQKKIPKMA
jgi:hypothetical protein